MPHDYALLISIQPMDPRVGDPIEIRIVLINRSSVTVRFGQRSLVFDWRYELTGQRGSPVAMTRYGEEGVRAMEGPPAAVLRTLGPGERLEAAVPLHEIFDLAAPGWYRLVVSRSMPVPGEGTWTEVRSASLEFVLRS
jgi:hypothetical protein